MHDTVELCDGPLRMEAASARREVEMTSEIGEASARCAPFVKVTGQQRRYLVVQSIGMNDGGGLFPAPQPGQVEMHAEQAQFSVAKVHMGDDRTARLQIGQVDDVAHHDLRRFAHQNGVAVPANAVRLHIERRGFIIAMMIEQHRRNGGNARAKTAVGLLQSDDIGVEFGQYRDYPFRIAAAVRAYGFADIVAGYADGLRAHLILNGAGVPKFPVTFSDKLFIPVIIPLAYVNGWGYCFYLSLLHGVVRQVRRMFHAPG